MFLNASSSCGAHEQAAHLTGGQYARLPQPVALLQHLLAAAVAGARERDLLAPPPAPPVDLRASCFCHRRPVDVGYACSVRTLHLPRPTPPPCLHRN